MESKISNHVAGLATKYTLHSVRSLAILAALLEKSPMTCREIGDVLAIGPHDSSKRLTDLKSKGAVNADQKCRCKVSGRIVNAWSISEADRLAR